MTGFLKKPSIIAAMISVCMLICAWMPFGTDVIKLSEKDNGREVRMCAGQVFEVALEGNPTTGYTWTVAYASAGRIKKTGEKYRPKTKALGSPGIMTMKFSAVSPGKASLKLIYHRPWEKNIPPVRSFQINILVR